MAGHALVVDGGHLAPGGERRLIPSGTAHHIRPGRDEVLARAGVVDAAVVGRGDAALDPADRLGDVEVGAGHLGDGLVGELLHPVAERLLARDGAVGVGVERGDGVVDGAAGDDLVGDGSHLVLDPVQLVEAPGVRLVEVDLGAEEVPRLRDVRRAADAVRGHVRAGRAPRRGSARTRRTPPPPRVACSSRRCRRDAGMPSERATSSAKKSPALPSWPVHERTCPASRPIWRVAETSPWSADRVEGRAVVVDRRGNAGEPRVDVGPVLLGRRRHQVEHAADRVQPRW